MDNCAVRKTEREEESKKALINRLSRIEGQVRGLKRMVEDDVYCTDIINQASAVSSAIAAFSKELLSRHLNGCVVNSIKAGNTEVVDDLLSTIERLIK